jgi:hypothetical protein
MKRSPRLQSWRTTRSRLCKHTIGTWSLEFLETRHLLAAYSTSSDAANVNIEFYGQPQSTAAATGGYTPTQIQQVYGFNQIVGLPNGNYNNAGAGQTIAIIDWNVDPDVSHDLQQFDENFNIGGSANDPTSLSFFKVVNQDGGSPSTVAGLASQSEAGEQALDVEWAHAMAPGANILLVEADEDNTFDLDTAIRYAASQPGVSVVSMSYGGGENDSELAEDSVFVTPTGHQGVAFVAASGDTGAPAGPPATSPNVLAVGGTSLPANSSSGNPSLSLETGWSGSTGGLSQYEIEPSYQVGIVPTSLDPNSSVKEEGFTASARAVPDVAYDADPATGYAVYDSYIAPAANPSASAADTVPTTNPWTELGGTSAAAPQWAALIAIADQQRTAMAEGTLDGPSQLLPAIYQISQSDPSAFNDITQGTSTGKPNYSAQPGYDLVTGLGTPNAENVVADLLNFQNATLVSQTVYWTGDAGAETTGSGVTGGLVNIYDWDNPANWSLFDPKTDNIPGSVLPGPNDNVVIDLDNQDIFKGPVVNQDKTGFLETVNTYDKISSLTVTGQNVTIQINGGTLDLSGGGTAGTLQVDQPGDNFYLGGTLVSPSVTSKTTVTAVVGDTGTIVGGTFAGTLHAPSNSTLELNGNWKNSGTITADAGATLILGDTWSAGESDAGAKTDAWSNTGTITIGQGTNVELGGWLSSDPQSKNLATLSLSTAVVTLIGTLDNSQSTLALTPGVSSVAGGWTMEGRIDQGDITETGGATLNADGDAVFDGVTVDIGTTVDISNGAKVSFEGQNWSNRGAINASAGTTLNLYGSWSNTGSITVSQLAASISGPDDAAPGDSVTFSSTVNDDDPNATITYAWNVADANGNDDTPTDDSGTSLDFEPQTAGTYTVTLTVTDSDGDGAVAMASATLTVTSSSDSDSGSTDPAQVPGNSPSAAGTPSSGASTSTTTLNLGSPLDIDPTSAAAAGYIWTSAGTIAVDPFATLNLGGVFTTQTYNGLINDLDTTGQTLPTINLTGTLDNSAADNPANQDVLALTDATGPLSLSGGRIYQGTITTLGTNVLMATASTDDSIPQTGTLDGVTLDGTLDMSKAAGAYVYVIDGLTVNGTIKLGGAAGSKNNAILYLGKGGTADQTIDGTGFIIFGQDSAGDLIENLSSGKIVFGPKLTVQGGLDSTVFSTAEIDNQGAFEEKTSAGETTVTAGGGFYNGGSVIAGSGSTLNFLEVYTQTAGATTADGALLAADFDLDGGTVVVATGGTVNVESGDYAQSAGATTVDGTLIAVNLQLIGGTLNGTGTIKAFVDNEGSVYPGDDPGTLNVDGNYTQTSTGTLDIEIESDTVFSQLAVTGTVTLAGTLKVSLLNAFVPNLLDSFAMLTFSQLSGNFGTVVGLPVTSGEVFVPAFTSGGATLTAAATTIYWTGDAGDSDWTDRGNWSFTDPAGAGGKGLDGALLPGAYSNVIVDVPNQTINFNDANNDADTNQMWWPTTQPSLTVTAPSVTLNFSDGMLDLTGADGRGTFEVDQSGDVVNLEDGFVLRGADVTSGTTLNLTGAANFQSGLNATLDGIQLDGILATLVSNPHNFGEVGVDLLVLSGLVLNGTVQVGLLPAPGTLPGGFPVLERDDITFGQSNDKVAQTISGRGTFEFGPNYQDVGNASNEPLTIGPQITIEAGMNTQISGPLDNEGTIKEDTQGGQLTITGDDLWMNNGLIEGGNGSTVTLGGIGTGSPVTVTTPSGDKLLLPQAAWINGASGQLSATGATLDVNGVWVNEGTISVDSTSSVALGSYTLAESMPSPSSPLSTWTNAGTLAIADGANVALGGIFTTDAFNALNARLAANAQHLAKDMVTLIGTLDNSAADNPTSDGVLALDDSTGPLYIHGLIYQGTISTSGSDDLVATSRPDSGAYSFLDGVELDGTLDMGQIANSSLYVDNNLVLNGTILLGRAAGSNDIATLAFDSNTTTVSGTGTIQFGQSGNGIPGSGNTLEFYANTVTVDPNITIKGSGGIIAISLVNQGTIQDDDPGGALSLVVGQWTNDGSIEVSHGATMTVIGGVGGFTSCSTNSTTGRITATDATLSIGNGTAIDASYGASWTNAGNIAADESTLYLQGPLNDNLNDPNREGGNWSNTGTISVTGGSTVYLGGVFTTDTFASTFNTSNPVVGTLNLTGTVDNVPADNPNTGGNLVLNASTGPLNLAGGRIIGGTITTAGSDDLVATAAQEQYLTQDVVNTSQVIQFGLGGGVLDGITLDGTLDMTQFVYANANVVDGIVLNGTIELGGPAGTDHFAVLFFGTGLEQNNNPDSRPDTTPETISGTGTIVFGQDNVAATPVSTTVPDLLDGDAIYDTIAAKLTIGPKITIEGGSASYILGDGVANADVIDNQGTIEEDTNGGVLTVAVPAGFNNAGTVDIDGGTLSTVRYEFGLPGQLTIGSATDYNQSAGATTVDGTLNAADFNLNGGTLNGTGTVEADLNNAATLSPGDAPGTLSVQGNYVQTSAGTLDAQFGGASQFSQLATSGTAALNGTLNVSLATGYTPDIGDAFKVLTFDSSSGTFATTNGLNLAGGDTLVPAYNPADLTLTVTGQQLGDSVSVASSQPSGSVYGQSVTFTATVSGQSRSSPGGTVQFQIDGSNYGQPVNLSDGAVTLTTGNLPAGKYSVNALYSGNAQFLANNGALSGGQTVAPAPLTITANDQSMVYGGTLPALMAGYSGFVNGDAPASLTTAPTLSSTATANSPVGNYAITASGAADPNYTISYISGTFGVTPATLTITANAQSMVAGGNVPTLTASFAGLVNGDTPASLTTPPALSTTATTDSPPGAYPISVSGAADPNYNISYVPGTLTVSASTTGGGGIAATHVPVTGYEYSPPTAVTVATFTDTQPEASTLPVADFSAMIDWGDGTTSAGSVTLASGTYAVAGTHEYLDNGQYTINVSIQQTAGPANGVMSATVSAPATIYEPLENGVPGTPDYNFIEKIYHDLFGRVAEPQGFIYWTNLLAQGVPRAQVVYTIVELAYPEESQRDEVASLYEQFLGRAPDPQGDAFWIAYLYAGGSVQSMSQALVDSPEFFARAGGTDDGFLSLLFSTALDRPIDDAADAYFSLLLADGTTPGEVAHTVFSSDEYRSLQVTQFFQQFLDRPPEPAALTYFTNELAEGYLEQDIITQLIASDEYYAKAQI